MSAGLGEAISFITSVDMSIAGTSILGVGIALLIPFLITRQRDSFLALVLPVLIMVNTIGFRVSPVVSAISAILFIYVTFADIRSQSIIYTAKTMRKASKRIGSGVIDRGVMWTRKKMNIPTGGLKYRVTDKTINALETADKAMKGVYYTAGRAPGFIRERAKNSEDLSDIQ